MFGVIFIRRSAREKHNAAPLRQERERFLSHLQDQGYSRLQLATMANLLLHIVRLLGLTSMRPVSEVEVLDGAARWAQDAHHHLTSTPGPGTAKTFQNIARRWLRFHKALIPLDWAAPAHEDLLIAFAKGERERGVSAITTRSYSRRVRYFLDWYSPRYESFEIIRAFHVQGFLDEKRGEGWVVRTMATQCQALRSFFRHAEAQGWCVPGIARSIKSPRIPKYEEAPKGPPWTQVRRLIRLTRTDKASDLRALPIMLLCAVYGLRSIEVANLRLDDIDWRSETITIRRAKRGRTQQFPLQYEVGEAIIGYLQHARPSCACRNLFVTIKRPFGPVRREFIWVILSQRTRRWGIQAENLGAHALRHACATQLLRKGSSLQDIADFLGHRDLRSVGIYVKHDPRMLRKVATFSLAGIV